MLRQPLLSTLIHSVTWLAKRLGWTLARILKRTLLKDLEWLLEVMFSPLKKLPKLTLWQKLASPLTRPFLIVSLLSPNAIGELRLTAVKAPSTNVPLPLPTRPLPTPSPPSLLTRLHRPLTELHLAKSPKVAPLFIPAMFGQPLDELFTRFPTLTTRSGLTLHLLWTMLGAQDPNLDMFPMATLIWTPLAANRTTLPLFETTMILQLVRLVTCEQALTTLLVLQPINLHAPLLKVRIRMLKQGYRLDNLDGTSVCLFPQLLQRVPWKAAPFELNVINRRAGLLARKTCLNTPPKVQSVPARKLPPPWNLLRPGNLKKDSKVISSLLINSNPPPPLATRQYFNLVHLELLLVTAAGQIIPLVPLLILACLPTTMPLVLLKTNPWGALMTNLVLNICLPLTPALIMSTAIRLWCLLMCLILKPKATTPPRQTGLTIPKEMLITREFGFGKRPEMPSAKTFINNMAGMTGPRN